MNDDTLANFVASLHQDVLDAMKAADESNDAQYRLGVRRLAKSFFDNFELFQVGCILPAVSGQDVDAWYAGRDLEAGNNR